MKASKSEEMNQSVGSGKLRWEPEFSREPQGWVSPLNKILWEDSSGRIWCQPAVIENAPTPVQGGGPAGKPGLFSHHLCIPEVP